MAGHGPGAGHRQPLRDSRLCSERARDDRRPAMPQHTHRQRRLRVSTLAAMANPSSQRLDVWHLLDDATQQLAAVHRAGLDTAVEEGRVRRQLTRLAAYERYW